MRKKRMSLFHFLCKVLLQMELLIFYVCLPLAFQERLVSSMSRDNIEKAASPEEEVSR